MTLPNFLIIGAAKSGTTALYHYLKQHPQIFFSARKEPHYFSYTQTSKQTNGPSHYVKNAITDFYEYKSLFDDANGYLAVGEASPTYLYIPEAGWRIKELIPSVKMIAILRNPVERAYSAYMHLVRDNLEVVKSFEEGLSLEETRIRNNWGPIYHYKKCGLYGEQLARFYELFSPAQILVLRHEEFELDPHSILERIYSFLEIKTDFRANTSFRPNVSGNPRSIILQNCFKLLFDKPNLIRTVSRKVLPETMRWKVTSNLRNSNLEKSTMKDTTRKELINYFSSDIESLSHLLNEDFSGWLRFKVAK